MEQGTIKQNRQYIFAGYHPGALALLMTGILVFTMLWYHPVYAALSLMGAALALLRQRGMRGLLRLLPLCVFACAFTLLFNTLFNTNGATALFYIGEYPILKEGFYFGLCAAMVFSALLLWLTFFSSLLTGDGVRVLLSGAFPTLALLLSMILQQIATLRRNWQKVSEAGIATTQTEIKYRQKVGRTGNLFSALLGNALEDAVLQAESMLARGYGSTKRTRLRTSRLHRRDGVLFLVLLVLFFLAGIIGAFGYTRFVFYPIVGHVDASKQAIWTYILYAVLYLLPLILEGTEGIRWKYYRSKM